MSDDHRRNLRDLTRMAFLPVDDVEPLLALLECADPQQAAAYRARFVTRHPIFALERGSLDYVGDDGVERTLPNFYNFERGDAVAVLPFDRERGLVLLVEQVRFPVYRKDGDGWLIETVAGMPRSDAEGNALAPEDHVACALRELEEETGIQLDDDPTRIFPRHPDNAEQALVSYYASPGGSSERIHVFLADVTGKDSGLERAGKDQEHEYTRIHRVKMSEFFDNLRGGLYHDAKIHVAADMLRRFYTGQNAKAGRDEPRPRVIAGLRRAEGAPERFLGVLPGDIMDWPGAADVWVNSEDQTLSMDRIISRSFSATLRSGGAVWADQRARVRLLDDSVAKELARHQKSKPKLGDVFVTGAGGLLLTHDVRMLVHVVATEIRGRGPVAAADRSAEFAAAALGKIDAANRERGYWTRRDPCRSAALPLFGTGNALADPEAVISGILEGVRKFWAETPDTRIERIYLSCFDPGHYWSALRHLSSFAGSWLEPAHVEGEAR